MGCHQILATAVTLVGFAGCQSERPALAAGDPPAVVAELPGNPSLPVPRLQKPDNPNPPIRQTTFEAVSEPFPGVSGGRVMVQIRAHVNGVAIMDEEIRNACYPALIPTLSLPEPDRSIQQNEIFRRELQQIIDREVLLQDAFAKLSKSGTQYLDKLKAAAAKEFDKVLRSLKTRANCKTDEELKVFLRSQGQSLEGIQRQVERNFMASQYVRSRIFPAIDRIGRQEIVEYFNDHAAEFQVEDSVDWQDIFIDASKYATRDEARRFAEQLASRAHAGEDFIQLAKFDNGSSSYQNAEGFGHHKGEINPPEAEPILFQMHDGQVGPLVELPTGFHIIRLAKRQYAGHLTLDEKTQGEIRKKLQGIVAEREAKKLIDDLRSKAAIEIAGSPVTGEQAKGN
jgi:parvulin-like peptidyl-prolyl isomerase